MKQLRVENYKNGDSINARLSQLGARFLPDKSNADRYVYQWQKVFVTVEKNKSGGFRVTYYGNGCLCNGGR